MKKFPPLHAGTQEALAECFDAIPPQSLTTATRAAYNAEIDHRVGVLMLLVKLNQSIQKHPEMFTFIREIIPSAFGAILDGVFGRASAAAARAGDRSFFDQVTHCLEIDGVDAALNLAWLGSYLTALEVRGDGTPPQAAEVAEAFNAYNSKTKIEARIAADACAKKALSLPLAAGARGKKRKVEKPS